MTDQNIYRKTFPVSWDELHRNGRALAWRLSEGQTFKGLIAVTRGGLVPAAIVARELDLRLIDTVCITSYRADNTRGELRTLKAAAMTDNGNGWLVVDDLVDTGHTIKIVREALPKAHYATVYAKPAGRPLVDTFITEVSQDTWILFPWDQEPQYARPVAELRNGKS